MKNNRPSTSWLSRLSHSFSGEPHNKLELIELLRDACKRDLLDGDAL
jgi:Mg2+/Co2+ transporter CorC